MASNRESYILKAMRHWEKILIVVTIFVVLIGGTLLLAKAAYMKRVEEVKREEQKRKDLYFHILDGISTKPTEISVDYSKPTSIGSPLVFGGNHAPDPTQQDAWNKIKEIGVTSIRKDFFIDIVSPSNITLDQYKNNFNNVQYIENWNMKELNILNDTYRNAKMRGIKTIGIVDYAPSWLTYSKTIYGVPKDWDVYEDLVKKTYRYYRDNLDFVEIWNEPNFDFFLNIDDSNLSRDQAYKQIFYHAAKAIREVDKEKNDGKMIPIGGPAGYDPINTSTLNTLLDSPEIGNELNFVSYHNYDKEHLKEPSWVNYKEVLTKYHKQDIPIFISEWNYSPDSKEVSIYNTGVPALLYSANKFLAFLQMGVFGANYHVIEALNEDKSQNGEGYMGFYHWINGNAQLLPQAKAWRILSKDMALGKGKSNIYTPKATESDLNMIGFTNVERNEGIAIVNSTSSAQAVSVKFKNLTLKNFARVQVYYASATEDATKPVYEGTIVVNKDGSAHFDYYLPDQTIIGIKLMQEKEWFDLLF